MELMNYDRYWDCSSLFLRMQSFLAVNRSTDRDMEEENNCNQPTRRAGRRKRSEVWDHFEQKAEYKYCKALLCADPARDGTSRLKKHYEETCPARHPNKSGRAGQQHGSPAASSERQGNHVLQNASTISKSTSDGQQTAAASAAAEDQLIRMIALHGFPSSMVEYVEFIRFVQMLCPDFKMLLRDDVEERCDALFDQEMSSLKDAIARTPGLVSLSIGVARTAMVNTVFLAAHFIDDEWNLCRRVIRVFRDNKEPDAPCCDHILDVKDLSNDSDDYDKLVGTVSSYGLLPKLSGAILDQKYLSRFRHKLYESNHLKHLSATQHQLFRATNILHRKLNGVAGILAWNYSESRYGEHCLLTFVKLCLTKKERRDISSRLRLNHPWTSDRWWYPLYYALRFLHDECSSAAAEIASLVGDDTFQETDTTEVFRTTLDVIYNAIETVAGSSSPTSNLSLIELVKLKRKIDSECTNAYRRKDDNDDEDTNEQQAYDIEDYDMLQSHLEEVKKDMDEFFEDSYLSQSIPLILDPRFKLVNVERLLKKASLPPDRISKVQAAVVQLFHDYSNQGNARQPINHNNENVMDIDPFQQSHDSTFQTVGQSSMEHDHRNSQESITELYAYLQEKTVPIKQENFDILKWWKENCHRYPTVARMARDFLAIPVLTRPTPQMMTEITNHLRRYA